MHKFNFADCFLVIITGMIETRIRYHILKPLTKVPDWQNVMGFIEHEIRGVFIINDYLEDCEFTVLDCKSLSSEYEAHITLKVKKDRLAEYSLCNFTVSIKEGNIKVEIVK